MCKLIVGLQNKENKPEESSLSSMIFAQENILRGEHDGLGAMVLMKDNTFRMFRKYEDYNYVLNKVYSLADESLMTIVHSRTGTCGEYSLHNVHLFRNGDWVFAHNGFVSKYTTFGRGRGYYKPLYPSANDFGYQTPPTPAPIQTSFGTPPSTVIENHRADIDNDNLEGLYPEPTGYPMSAEDAEYERLDQKCALLMPVINTCRECTMSDLGYCRKHKNVAKEIEKIEEQMNAILSSATGMNSQENVYEEGDFTGTLLLKEGKESKKDKKSKSKEKQDDRDCDSLMFLKSFPQEITAELVKKKMKDDLFTGMGFLFNTRTRQGFIMIDKECKTMISPVGNSAIHCSFTPETEYTSVAKETVNIFGVEVDMKKESSVVVGEEPMPIKYGVYEINL